MFFSGISDEAGRAIDVQIRAHKELGWDRLELRMVGEHNICALPQMDFDHVCARLGGAGMTVSCYGSAIANWARPITADPQQDYDDLRRAAPRMRRTKTPYIRVMSYPNDEKQPLPENEWRDEAIRRVKEFARIAEGEGIILVHENCSGWGGLSAENSNHLLREVNSPALKVVYDTGNPVTYGQDPWDYYRTVRDAIAYVHVKDARKQPNGEDVYTWCGEGDGRVRDTIQDLLATGYTGGISIEPHLAAVIHTGQSTDNAQELYDSYVEYGRRLMRIVEQVQSAPTKLRM